METRIGFLQMATEIAWERTETRRKVCDVDRIK